MFGMKTRKTTDRTHDTASYDYVTLADGTTVAVARGNLVAAKALLAAQKAAAHRVAARKQREAMPAPATASPVPMQRHPLPARREQSLYRIVAAGVSSATDGRASDKPSGAPAQDGQSGASELRRIALPVALPCALDDCGQPTAIALIEPDPSGAGPWHLLPVCEDGANHVYADAASAVRTG